jgi:hypothetical protein
MEAFHVGHYTVHFSGMDVFLRNEILFFISLLTSYSSVNF